MKSTPIRITDDSKQAREFIDRLLCGDVEIDEPSPELGVWSELLINLNEDTYQADMQDIADKDMAKKTAMSDVKQKLDVWCKRDVNLNVLMRDKTPDTETRVIAARMPVLHNTDLGPTDPAVRGWLDDYIEYSKHWVPAAPYIWHEGAALFALSALIARRALIYGITEPKVTSLYMTLVSKSGAGKSSLARMSMASLRAVKTSDGDNLRDCLISTENKSAQKIILDASCRLDPEYEEWDEDEREAHRRKLKWAPFTAWFNDEYGKKLKAIVNPASNTAVSGIGTILLEWFDGYGTGSDTISRKKEQVGDVYLCFLGCMTYSNVKTLPSNQQTFWEDGLQSRVAALCSTEAIEFVPTLGDHYVPLNVSQPLQRLHDALGEPEVSIIPEPVQGKDGKEGKTRYKLYRKMPDAWQLRVSAETGLAYQRYMTACFNVSEKSEEDVPLQIASSYKRFPEYAVRIAALIAMINNVDNPRWNKVIELKHWIAAQEITERWRLSTHQFHAQVFEGERTVKRQQEDAVMSFFRNNPGKWFSLGILSKRHIKWASSTELESVLDVLVHAGRLVYCKCSHKKRSNAYITRYALPGSPLPENVHEVAEEVQLIAGQGYEDEDE